MSLRDRLRGLRGGDEGVTAAGEHDAAAAFGTAHDAAASLSGTVEVTEFAPRQDGDYRCAERGLYLRFARPVVTETGGAGPTDAARGEFTTSGRFTVQRPFGRPIVYTVLDDGIGRSSRSPERDAALVVRRTDTGTREAERLEFAFEPDEA